MLIFRGLSARKLASITFDECPSFFFFFFFFLLPCIPYPPGVKKEIALNALKRCGGFGGSKANEQKIELLAAGETHKAIYNQNLCQVKNRDPLTDVYLSFSSRIRIRLKNCRVSVFMFVIIIISP